MYEWTDGWMVNGCIDVCSGGLMDRWVRERMNRRMEV